MDDLFKLDHVQLDLSGLHDEAGGFGMAVAVVDGHRQDGLFGVMVVAGVVPVDGDV
ncbi:hypothetical protein [Streptomyces coffeae]|uniref:Uncharacterized protein n=1 Tax=Streptomyces coffeae TaxID=621382 RepID=A0ABS1N699_9ACTN|nr:hypothetical protein [Streptomyces coffeae]MBL1095548.1 hypothetical protein [Streptomyces coffeae]